MGHGVAENLPPLDPEVDRIMQVRSKISVLPDVLSVVAIAALMSVTYLCSQPNVSHSISHRAVAVIALAK
jgi:hypothetical protein